MAEADLDKPMRPSNPSTPDPDPPPQRGWIDRETGCVRVAPFQDKDGRWWEWIPWSEY